MDCHTRLLYPKQIPNRLGKSGCEAERESGWHYIFAGIMMLIEIYPIPLMYLPSDNQTRQWKSIFIADVPLKPPFILGVSRLRTKCNTKYRQKLHRFNIPKRGCHRNAES